MSQNLGDFVLEAREKRAFAMLNGMIGIAFTFSVNGETLEIEVEGVIPVNGDVISVPTPNSKLISILALNDTAFHSMGVLEAEADEVFKKLEEAWSTVKSVTIRQVMKVLDGEDVVGSNTTITTGLTKNFLLVMGGVIENYTAIGREAFVSGEGYPDRTMYDTTLFDKFKKDDES